MGHEPLEPLDLNPMRYVGPIVPVSREILIDAGLIEDDRPAPPPPSWRERVRRRVRARWWALRVRAGEAVAGQRFYDEWD
ncbi:MAG: hypothetical protein LC640_09390 [Frankia sp.]|nr:hypothetical protein [Frankia sp.]